MSEMGLTRAKITNREGGGMNGAGAARAASGATECVKATIINRDKLDTQGPPIASENALTCMFNPNAYTFSKQNSWKLENTAGSNVPQVEFGGGQPATLTMQLFFDTYTASTNGKPEDVRKVYTDGLWELMMVDETLKDQKNNKGRPPIVRFQWGKLWSFDAVITSLSLKFTLFSVDGTPVRATADVTFQQIKDEKHLAPQNPTSGGQGGERAWKVREGDTLALLAYKAYGDSKRWRLIADANQLTRVRDLKPGTTLLIPNG